MALHQVSDISLISDLSELGDPLSPFISLHSRLQYNSVSPQYESSRIRSPLNSESSNSGSTKQVRFNEAVSVSAADNHSVQNTEQGNHNETEDITTITPIHGITSQSEDRGSKVYLSHDYSAPQSTTRNDDSSAHSALKESQTGNTSLWLETPNEVEPRLHSSTTFKDSPSLGTNIDAGGSFFRTSDHLPRPPPHCNSSNSHNSRFSSTNPLDIPQAMQSSDLDLPVPRPPRTSSPSWKSLSLSSLVTDTLTETSDDGAEDFSKPRANTTRILADQIRKLTEKLSSQHLHNPGEEAWQKAQWLVNEDAVYSNMHNQLDIYTPNPGLTVNIPEHVSTYTNLMDLSVDESEIVREERERIAQQRLRMAHLRKEELKKKPQIPKPDLLEFFDPNRHVFQSVNLHIKGLPTFLPIISTASQDMVDVFHDRAMTDFCRLYM
ncbi:hypothetical protein D915_000676 [Fasciola hepatica]|uniref:Uncharacterized protein n=1 Tax=Fasciola hepatica TaxID=6192 RepID=A0A4E0S389_FASHE|nr:hypothetical protein D915_000676 [Fasciola hepatica]